MQDLLILGAGGSSQQIAEAILDINEVAPTWTLLGFLDDDPAKLGSEIGGLKVLGPIDDAHRMGARMIIGVASPTSPLARWRIAERLGFPDDRYATIVHPSAFVSRRARVGAGSAILQNVVVTQNTVLGRHVIALQNVTIGHDVTIGDGVTVAGGAAVMGFSTLGNGCYVGARSAINNYVVVKDGALVGLGAVVVRDVAAGVTVVGNPARALPPKP